jgi:hypothetical protein
MNDADLHELLQAAWSESQGDWDMHEQVLHRKLLELPLADLVDFTVIQTNRRRLAFTPLLINAAFMVWDGALGNDGFLDFTDNLSVIPHELFECVVADPDRVIEVPALWTPCEKHFWNLSAKVFDQQKRAKPGTYMLNDYLPPDDRPADLWTRLKGHPNRQTAQSMLPRLYARFGESAFA